jgi:hypothetical protein
MTISAARPHNSAARRPPAVNEDSNPRILRDTDQSMHYRLFGVATVVQIL